MLSAEILLTNRRHLRENLKRVRKILAHSDDGTFKQSDAEFEKGDAFVPKRVAEQNHKATRKLYDDIIAALKRMKRGVYEFCVDCGGEIGEDRLVALPEADTCISCKEKRKLRAH